VIGFRRRATRTVPAFIARPQDAETLVYNPACRQNLAVFLRKPEVRRYLPVAMVATPSTLHSIARLTAESQAPADTVLAIGVNGDQYLGVMTQAEMVEWLRRNQPAIPPDPELVRQVQDLAAKTPAERAAFWSAELERCTRCYACRSACPGCYCTRCVTDQNRPQWISQIVAAHGNFGWHMTRAFHQAGRCVLCGACQEACPQNIPLMLLNQAVERAVAEETPAPEKDADPGRPVIGSWSPKDNNEFIR
jgi:formate dehydrogenase subunit beta